MATNPRSADASGTEPATRTDLYSRITAKIVADLEQGMRPWNAGHLERRVICPLRHNGIPYQGTNTIMLWMAAVIAGYQSPHWFTFRQARELGGNVRKGEHGELVVYADRSSAPHAADRATHPCCRPVLFRDRSRDPSRRPITPKAPISLRCRRSRRSATPKATPPRSRMNACTGRNTTSAWRAIPQRGKFH